LTLAAIVVGLFAFGIVWQATHPDSANEIPTEERDIAARQDGYYLCLHRPEMSPAQMYRLVKRKLPNDKTALALRGCQEAQQGVEG